MNIKETFLNLTKHTVPYLKEYEYLKDVFPFDIMKKDSVGNYYIKIGNSNSMFAAHLDTVGGDVEINHVIEKNIIKSDGKSVLGADDKSGVVVLLYMIQAGVPGLYVFFLGEEVGCKGSRALSSWIDKNKDNEIYKNINKVVSFDRKDVDSIITHQMGERTASDEFADSLIVEFGKAGLKYRKDTGGVLTDSVHFTDLYSECTNISVGYWNQHQNIERQDIEFLEKLAKACTKVDWDNLTIKRKPGEVERLSYGSYGGRTQGRWNEWEDDYDYTYSGGGYSNRSTAGYNYGQRQATKQTQSRSTAQYVTDWNGDTVATKDTVWCEFEKVHCLKDEAIWVDLLGFYTPPDKSTKKTSKSVNTSGSNNEINYSNSDGKVIKNANELSISDNVLHPTFGRGVVKTISPDMKKVLVNFEVEGQKQLLISIAKIKKL